MGKVELVCLGTGNHLTALYEGCSSSSCAILVDGFPVLLVGCGIGTIRGCLHYLHQVPDTLLLLNDTPSQCAELGALVAGETSRGRQLKVYAQDSICQVAAEQLRREMNDEAFAHKVQPQLVSLIRLSLTSELIPLCEDLSVLMHPNYYRREQQSVAVSVVLFFKDLPILSITGPSSFDTSLLAKLCNAPFVLAWAVPNPSSGGSSQRQQLATQLGDGAEEHDESAALEGGETASETTVGQMPATVSEMSLFADKVNNSRPHEERVIFLLTGFGSTHDTPMVAGQVNPVQVGTPTVLLAGEVVHSQYGPLEVALPNLRKAASNRKSTGAGMVGVGGGGGPLQPVGSRTLNRSPSPQATGAGAGSGSGGVKTWDHHGSGGTQPAHTYHASQDQSSIQQHSQLTQGGARDNKSRGAQRKPPQHPRGGATGNHHHDPHNTSVGSAASRQQQQYPSSYEEAGLAVGVSNGHGGGNQQADISAVAGGRSTHRRVFIFNNEDKGVPGKLVMLSHFRRLDQLHQKASEMTKLKPIRDLVYGATGRSVLSVDEVPDLSELIVIRRGGVQYDPTDLPRLMRSRQDVR